MDINAANSLSSAKAAVYPIEDIDTYFYPCGSCGNPAGQISTFWNNVVSCKMEFKRVWFDVEGFWTSSRPYNQQFLMTLVEKAKTLGIEYGIFTSSYHWEQILENYTFPYASTIPLWYINYDSQASFNDFTSFGGWETPLMKRYTLKDFSQYCQVYFSLDWRQ